MSACPDPDYEDYYRYTSGRWLWDEETQLRERYKRFNVPELKKKSRRKLWARGLGVSISKLAEGWFNKVFRLAMDDGGVVIARIPNPNAGPDYCVGSCYYGVCTLVCSLRGWDVWADTIGWVGSECA
ncbi:hypothetical protein BDW02DRAFT_48134 [Decorospora gaudefroyi]|uniref:Uncharacterized protein n=1 Tax=Decorospora gaudefroyi TaxID=184978 RepID=A0A6A5K5Z8_9PLEO|nr:hypothetical protein BDW02DRAFT_48134 [Decorospora gaudefroyi]